MSLLEKLGGGVRKPKSTRKRVVIHSFCTAWIHTINADLHMLTLKVISHVPNVPANSRPFEFWRVFVPMRCRGIVCTDMKFILEFHFRKMMINLVRVPTGFI